MGNQCESGEGKEVKEFRGQRHDFILHYYNMAVKDLDRHLLIGWQTIAVVAGAAASLSLGYKGDLPVPIAVVVTVVVLCWGMLNIIDANFWALRAIAFLANVEAVYFRESDRQFFNPYAGKHPRYELLRTLAYQAWLILALLAVAVVFAIWSGLDYGSVTEPRDVLLWSLSLWFLLGGIWVIFTSWRRQLGGYRRFVKDSPGPGMIKAPGVVRPVDFSREVDPAAVTGGEEIQREVLERLDTGLRTLDIVARRLKLILILLGVVAQVVLLLAILAP